jgi:hypothetical protein
MQARQRLRDMALRLSISYAEQSTRVQSRPKPGKHKLDPKREARDRWIYRKCCQPRYLYKTIIAELKAISPGKGWSMVATPQGIRWLAAEYAQRHDKPEPPRRR